ncbi:MAG: hypothetical protein PHT02_12680 [Tissierellia bacterium]|nr:hypothetical protein [Tissierellia bacterium]
MMLFGNLNVETKTLRIISLIITFIGIIFILASNYVGNLAIRLSMIIIFILCLLNYKMTYNYSSVKEKLNMLFALVGSLLVFIKPSLTMFIIGVAILIITVPYLYKSIKNKDYSDKVMLILSTVGTLFSIYCILNTRAALNAVINIIGIAFVILGCLMFFDTFNTERKRHAIYEHDKHDVNYGFEKTKDRDFYD